MEVITVESAAFKKIVKQLEDITAFIEENREAKAKAQFVDYEESYVDSDDVKRFLGISERTMQRIRTERLIPYSKVRGKAFYKIKDIRAVMESQVIRTKHSDIEELINKIRKNAL